MKSFIFRLAWVELILGFIGSIYFVWRDGFHDGNLGFMISIGLLISAVSTYAVDTVVKKNWI